MTLDFQAKRVSIVEVSAAYNIHDLARKVANSEHQWFEKLRPQLQRGPIVPKDWTYGIEVFIRKDRHKEFANQISGTAGVKVTPLESLTVPWQWNWEREESE